MPGMLKRFFASINDVVKLKLMFTDIVGMHQCWPASLDQLRGVEQALWSSLFVRRVSCVDSSSLNFGGGGWVDGGTGVTLRGVLMHLKKVGPASFVLENIAKCMSIAHGFVSVLVAMGCAVRFTELQGRQYWLPASRLRIYIIGVARWACANAGEQLETYVEMVGRVAADRGRTFSLNRDVKMRRGTHWVDWRKLRPRLQGPVASFDRSSGDTPGCVGLHEDMYNLQVQKGEELN